MWLKRPRVTAVFLVLKKLSLVKRAYGVLSTEPESVLEMALALLSRPSSNLAALDPMA
jgi:hypothetical protein